MADSPFGDSPIGQAAAPADARPSQEPVQGAGGTSPFGDRAVSPMASPRSRGFSLFPDSNVGQDILDRGAPVSLPYRYGDYSWYENIIGALDAGASTAATIGQSLPGMTVGGLVALGHSVKRLSEGDPEPNRDASKIMEEYSTFLNPGLYATPATEPGEAIQEGALDLLQIPIEWLDAAAKDTQDYMQETTGTSGAGEATAVVMLPDLLSTLAGIPLSRSKNAMRVAELRKNAKKIGVDPGADYLTQLDQMEATAQRIAGDRGYQELPQTQKAMQNARTETRDRISRKFDEAKDENVAFEFDYDRPMSDTLMDRARVKLGRQTVDQFPTVQRVLTDMERLDVDAFNILDPGASPAAARTYLNDIMELRESINADLPSDIRSPEYRALTRLKSGLDDFVQDQFDNAMLNGSQKGINMWREAIGDWSDFKKLYDDDRTIIKIMQEDLNPEQIKRLIFNKSAINPGADSGPLVAKIKQMIGEDSPQFQALRSTVLTDLMEPLLKADPNLTGFADTYRKFRKDNPSLVKELFPPEMLAELDATAAMALGIGRNIPLQYVKGWGVARWLSVMAFGNELARNALKISGASRVIKMLTGGESRADKILRDGLNIRTRDALFGETGMLNMGNQPAETATFEYLRDRNEDDGEESADVLDSIRNAGDNINQLIEDVPYLIP